MLLTFVAATPFEIAPLIAHLENNFEAKSEFIFTKGKLEVHFLITGIGMTATAYSLGKYLAHQPSNLLINLGIAGAYNKDLKIGEVVNIISDRFGDLGAEDADGSFLDMEALGLQKANDFPFQNSVLYNLESATNDFLPKANSLTVNKVNGHKAHIEQVKKQYSVDIESMEGAAFFYACLVEKKSFLQIRSISNYVESRNKDNWNIPLAIDKLNEVAISMLSNFIV